MPEDKDTISEIGTQMEEMYQAMAQRSTHVSFAIALLGVMFFVSSTPAESREYLRLKNRWRESYVHNQQGDVTTGPVEPGMWSAIWSLESVSGTDYFRLRNRWKKTYLHVQNGPLALGTVEPGWWSAMWSLERVSGTDFFRLKNRWEKTYLHVQNGPLLEAGAVEPGWWSAMWTLESFPQAWERGRQAQGVWRAFSKAVPKPDTVTLDYTGGECSSGHIQGVARLIDGRFFLPHSTCQRPGRWLVQKRSSSDKMVVFDYGRNTHASPLQASGDLVVAPLTWNSLGTDSKGKKVVYLFDVRTRKPKALYEFPSEFGVGRAGIVYHPQQGRHLVTIGGRLFGSNGRSASDEALAFKEINLNRKLKGGEGGVALVYDQSDGDVYSFSFHDEYGSSDGDTLVVERIEELSDAAATVADRKLVIPFHGMPFDATPEGASWRWGGGLKVVSGGIEIYKADRGGSGGGLIGGLLDDIHIAVFIFK